MSSQFVASSMEKFRKTGFCIILCLWAGSLSATDGKVNYQKGWDAFNNNQPKEAAQYFYMATHDLTVQAEAHLALALLEWNHENPETALKHFMQFYQQSPNPYPYLYAMFTHMYVRPLRGLPVMQLKFYQQLLRDPHLHGTLRAMIHQELGDYYQECNQPKLAEEHYRQIAFVDKWQILGAFDNISGSGFEKDWGALANPQTDAVFKNKLDANIFWFAPGESRADGWFDFEYCFSLDDIITYAQSFIYSNDRKEVILRIGVSGSLKLWLNDALIASIEKERNCDLDVYAYKVRLNQGNNRLLVQIGQSEVSMANFLVRLTDEHGHPIAGVRNSDRYGEYAKEHAPYEQEMLPFFPEAFFETRIREEPDNLLYYIALADVYLRNDKSYEGTHILKRAEMLAPHSSYIKSQLSEAYLRAGNRTDYSRMIEFINQNDPTSYAALCNKFEEYTEAEKYGEAATVLDRIKSLYGQNKTTDYMDVETASNSKQTDELIQLLQRLYIKYPYNYNYMSYNAYIQENVFGNAKASFAVLSKYCKKYADMSAWDDLAQYYFSKGKTTQGLDVLQRKITYKPYAVGYKINLVNRLQQMQRYGEVLSLLNDLKTQLPYHSELYNKEGYVHKAMQNHTLAKACFDKAVYYNPTDYDSRMQLRLLDNKKEVFDLFPKSNAESLIAQSPSAADYPEDNSVLLLYDNQLVFYPEGAQEHRVEIAIKALTPSAVEQWKEYQIEYYANQRLLLDKYEIIKANGQKVKAETNHSGRIVFANLEAGDVLHLIYRLQDYRRGILAKHFYDVHSLQFFIPSVYVRYAVLAPSDRKFEYIVKNTDRIAPEITDIENMKLYQWIAVNQPAVKEEPYMPTAFADIAPVLVFSSIPDWKFVSSWYKDITANKFHTQQDYIFKATHEQILQGKEGASAMEKAKLFYEYILNNITYSQVSFLQSNLIPQKPSRTLTTRLGDCKDVSTLFVALCRASGIEANLVLLQSRDMANNSMALPTNSFNHCIAQMNLDGQTYYLELTNNKLPFCAVVEEDLHANILPIPYKDAQETRTHPDVMGAKLLRLEMPNRKRNEIIRTAQIRIEDNNMQIMHSTVRTGQPAALTRYQYGGVGQEERLKQMSQVIATGWNVPVRLTDLQFVNLDNLEDSLRYSYRIEAAGVLQDVAGMKICKLPWTDAVTSLSETVLEERKYPFEFWRYVFCDNGYEQITLILPEGKQLIEKPADVKVECSAARYELSFDVSAKGKLIATRSMVKKKDTVLPEEYRDFQQFMKDVNTADNKQIAIK
jgi:hypothetical protein